MPVTDMTLSQDAASKMSQFLTVYKRQIFGVLPKHMDAKRIGYLVLNQITKTPALAGCTPMSFINAILLASNMRLEIRQNSAYLVPFGKECQLLIDYRGKIAVAAQAGVTVETPILVREGDVFDYGYTADGITFRWTPAAFDPDGREVVAGFVGGVNAQGRRVITVMGLSEIERIRARSRNGCAKEFEFYGKKMPGLSLAEIRAFDGQEIPRHYRMPWITDWDQMAKKTLVHRMFNTLPQSPIMSLSQEIDDAVDAGRTQPIAEQLEPFCDQIDPADDKPLVDGGGETREAQKASRDSVRAAKLKAIEDAGTTQPVAAESVTTMREKLTAEHDRLGRAAFFKVLGSFGCSDITELSVQSGTEILAALKEV